jgi:hypothetical protein
LILLFNISFSSIFNLTSRAPLAQKARKLSRKKKDVNTSTLYSKNLDLPSASARKKLTEGKRKFKLLSNFNSEEFRQVANGFFQAEGPISCRIRKKKVLPYFCFNSKFFFSNS